ncbi:MAG: cupin domain-containing protein [Saccharofermentanales bacterium]
MIEQKFDLHKGNEKIIERVLMDENIHYMHMVLNNGEGLPEHYTNSNVYMTVVRGILTIGLDDQEIHEYEAGTLLKIPFKIKMNAKNNHSDTLEIIVVKAPAPGV